MLVGQRILWIETNSNLSFITRESMRWMSETNGIVRDGVLKSLHCVENTDWESWSVGWEECSIMNPSLLNRLYSLSWLCMNCVLIIRIMSENGDEVGVAHHQLDRSVSIVDREWVDLIIRIMDGLGYGVNRDIRLLIVMNDSIRFVNWMFSDSWLSVWIGFNETGGMGIINDEKATTCFWCMIREQ